MGAAALLPGLREENAAVQFLERPAVGHKGGREPVEQLGMRRSHAVAAEIVGRIDQPGAEVMLPDAVDDHAPRSGLVSLTIQSAKAAGVLLRSLCIDLQRHKLAKAPA